MTDDKNQEQKKDTGCCGGAAKLTPAPGACATPATGSCGTEKAATAQPEAKKGGCCGS